jgi:hypothetical protein
VRSAYLADSGTGDIAVDPYAVMAGVIVIGGGTRYWRIARTITSSSSSL